MILLCRLGPPEAFRAKKFEGGTPQSSSEGGGGTPQSSDLHTLLHMHHGDRFHEFPLKVDITYNEVNSSAVRYFECLISQEKDL